MAKKSPTIDEINTYVFAARDGEVASVMKFLDQFPGAINSRNSADNWTGLTIAAWAGQLEVLHLLLKRGADVHVLDDPNGGLTALSFAAKFSQGEKMVALLLAHGAVVDAVDSQNNTPLMYAVVSDAYAGAELLIAAGANVNAQDARGETPLMMAVARADRAMVDLLLKQPALDFDLKNNEGATVAELVSPYDDGDIAQRIASARQEKMDHIASLKAQEEKEIREQVMAERLDKLKSRRPPRPKL